MDSYFTGPEEGEFFDMEMQSYDDECGEDPSRRRGADLRQTGIPTEMGSGFVNIASEEAGAKLEQLNPEEMHLPGLVVHLIKEENPALSWRASFWNSWQAERKSKYRAVLADRRKFQDLVISPSMFIDHMPWK